jgi:hypothetical protein
MRGGSILILFIKKRYLQKKNKGVKKKIMEFENMGLPVYKTSILIVFFTLYCITSLFSQQVNWTKLHSSSCQDIAVINDSSLFVLALYDIKYSTDGGNNWTSKNPSNTSISEIEYDVIRAC